MPTYKNNSAANITISEGFSSKLIQPNQIIQSIYNLLPYGLTKTLDTPYYNPIISEETLTTGIDNEVLIIAPKINVIVKSGSATLYFNSKTNIPALTLSTGDFLSFDSQNKILSLVIDFVEDGEIKVVQSNISIFAPIGSSASSSTSNGINSQEVKAEITRPANTNAYLAKAVISDSNVITFSNCVSINGAYGYIVKARLFTNSATGMLGTTIRLHLYHTAPTPIVDSAQMPLLYTNAVNRVGYIDFPALSTEGTGSDSALALWTEMPLKFKTAPASSNLYGIAEVITPGAAPVSGQKFYFFLDCEEYDTVNLVGGGVGTLTDAQLRDSPLSINLLPTENHIGAVGVLCTDVVATFARPNNNTSYTTKDAVSDSTSTPTVLTFTNIARVVGGSGSIVKAQLYIDSASALLGSVFRLHLYHTTPTAINDNSPFTLLYANRDKRIGYLDFPATITEGTGSDSSTSLWTDVPLIFTCVTRSIYGLLEIVTPGAAPTAAHNIWISLTVQNN